MNTPTLIRGQYAIFFTAKQNTKHYLEKKRPSFSDLAPLDHRVRLILHRRYEVL